MLMTEEMNRIVLRNADEREPEGERDAVDIAIDGTDSGKTGERRGRERQGREHRHAPAPIGNDQQHDEPGRRRGSKPGRFALGAFLHQGGKTAGSRTIMRRRPSPFPS